MAKQANTQANNQPNFLTIQPPVGAKLLTGGEKNMKEVCYIRPIQVRVVVDIPRNIYILPEHGWVEWHSMYS